MLSPLLYRGPSEGLGILGEACSMLQAGKSPPLSSGGHHGAGYTGARNPSMDVFEYDEPMRLPMVPGLPLSEIALFYFLRHEEDPAVAERTKSVVLQGSVPATTLSHLETEKARIHRMVAPTSVYCCCTG